MKSSTGNVQAVKDRATKDKSDGKPKVVFMLATEGPASMAPSRKSDKDGNPIVKPACLGKDDPMRTVQVRTDDDFYA